MATSSSLSKMCSLNEILFPPIGIMLMLSVPAAIITSASPSRMRSAAIDTACSPEEQKRLTVAPATVSGSPASSSATRATFMPCSASGIAQPAITSSIAFGSSDGTSASAAFSTCASRSSGRTLRNMPRGALPTGERFAATMYASCTCFAMLYPSAPPSRTREDSSNRMFL